MVPSRVLRDTYAESDTIAALPDGPQDRFPRYLLAADDFGCFRLDQVAIKGRLFCKRESVTPTTISSDFAAYEQVGIVVFWSDAGKVWGFFRGWFDNQNKPRGLSRRKTPPPPANLAKSNHFAISAISDKYPPAVDVDVAVDVDSKEQSQKLPSPSAPAPVASPTSSPLSVTPPPQKKSAGRSKRPEHVADPRHAPFKAHFMARWFAAKGAEFYWTPRDAKDAVRVLALGDNGEIRRRLEIALADPFFLKTGRVGQLADGWNGYANQYATGPPPRPDGGATAMLAEVDAIKRERAAKLSEAAGGRRDSADSAEPGGGAEPAGGRVA